MSMFIYMCGAEVNLLRLDRDIAGSNPTHTEIFLTFFSLDHADEKGCVILFLYRFF